jgi:hypothetical protein
MELMQTILAQAIPNQQLSCQLGAQSVTLVITQMAYGLFMTIAVAGVTILNNAPCQNLNRVVRDAYLGFVGDFLWFDTQGSSDPVYTGIGTRYQLLYLSPADLAAG